MFDEDGSGLPDVRDGLTREERIVLYCLSQIEQELNGRNVPTSMLYGRVLEYINISASELQTILQKVAARGSA